MPVRTAAGRELKRDQDKGNRWNILEEVGGVLDGNGKVWRREVLPA